MMIVETPLIRKVLNKYDHVPIYTSNKYFDGLKSIGAHA